MQLFIFLVLFTIIHAESPNEQFDEKLVARYLHKNKLYLSWEFELKLLDHFSKSENYIYFPKSIAQIAKASEINEFTLKFSSGQWNYEQWGIPDSMGPHGAELWSWFDSSSSQTHDSQWNKLTHGLSGIFCASLIDMDLKVNSSPKTVFERSFMSRGTDQNHTAPTTTSRGQSSSQQKQAQWLRHAILSREASCTENLSPWSKLLPCRRSFGLSALIEPHIVYNGDWHMQLTRVTRECVDRDCIKINLSMTQKFSTVLSIDGLFNNAELESNMKFGSKAQISSLLRTVDSTSYPAEMIHRCPMASKSVFSVGPTLYHSTNKLETMKFNDIDNTFIDTTATKSNNFEEKSIPFQPHVIYEQALLDNNSTLNFQLLSNKVSASGSAYNSVSHLNAPYLSIDKFGSGFGLLKGGLHVLVSNLYSEDITVKLFDVYPHFIRVYYHTLTFALNGTSLSNDDKNNNVNYVIINPSNVKHGDISSSIEVEVLIPAYTTFTLSIDYERKFLTLEQSPADPARGLDVPPAVIEFKNIVEFNGKNHSKLLRMYSPGVIINIPTGDFSMPFNVITLTCSLIAFFAGTLMNIVMKQENKSNKKQDKTNGTRGNKLSLIMKKITGNIVQKLMSCRKKSKEKIE